MHLVSGTPAGLPKGLYAKVARYRHKVFVERLGWPLQTDGKVELDQFDRSDTLYVVAQDEDGDVFGCARLLPTTGPYLLGEVFPQLLNGLPSPRSPDVWELSRFAAIGASGGTASALEQFSTSVTVKLLHESIACAAAHGAKRLITVSPIGIERLLHRAGVRSHRAGPPMIVDGHPIFACWIDI